MSPDKPYKRPEPKPLSDQCETWERQPGETDKDWILFTIYRDLAYPDGVEVPSMTNRRTIAACYLESQRRGIWTDYVQKEPSNHTPTKTRRVKWQWDRRCEDYDRHLERIRTAEREHRIKLSEQQFGDLARMMTQVLQTELAKLAKVTTEDMSDGVTMARISPKDIANLSRSAVQLTRVGNDEADVKVEGKLTYADLIRRAAEAGK